MKKYGKAGLAALGMALSVGAAAPGWADSAAGDREQTLQLGVLFYGDYGYYMKTGYQPQFLTQQVHPGATSSDYNAFEVTRTYLDFRYTPVPTWTLRVTPNLNRASDGNLNVRIKYAYLDKKGLFDGIAPMKGNVVTAGQEPNPLIGWEEDMWGYRFVNLVPWNYVSLSSTYTGISLHGPIKFNGLQYIDYDIGVFNNASFHAYEQVNAKQFMGRVSYYPLGASSRFAGLGLTAFAANGWGQPSDVKNTPAPTSNRQNLSRMAFLIHYNAPTWAVAAEYDKGRNAVSAGNLESAQNGFFYIPTSFNNAVKANVGGARQSGYAAFGHYDLPSGMIGSGWSVFAMYQHFEPNTDTKVLNFDRYTVGVAHSLNSYLALALDYQDFRWSNKGKLQGAGATSGDLSDTRAVFLNVQFKDNRTFHMHGGML